MLSHFLEIENKVGSLSSETRAVRKSWLFGQNPREQSTFQHILPL